jgi:hypothetical protein
LEPSVSGGDDIIWIGFPDEWLWVAGIVFVDEAVDGGLEVDDGMEDAVREPAPGKFGEEALEGSHEHEFGVKWKVLRGWPAIQSRTLSFMCAA